jgi:parvulin-like peptidyl-prolyl isomerase
MMARQRRIPTPSWERDRGLTGNFSGSRGQIFVMVVAILLVVAAVGVGAYALINHYEIQPRLLPGSTALAVGNTSYSTSEFSNRTKMFSTQLGGYKVATYIIPAVDQQLQQEAVIVNFASEKGVSATEDEIKTQIATLLGIQATDANFDQRLQEELKTDGLTQQQYHDMAAAIVLQTKLTGAFSSALPATADSVHYRMITVADQATADGLKTQIDDGADFAALATANSTDTTTKAQGGDAGWAPRGYLSASLETLLFSLAPNQVVTYPGTSNVTVYQVVEKDPAHAIEAAKKSTLATNAFQTWVKGKLATLTVTDNMNVTTGDAAKINYVFSHAGLTAQ